MLRFGTLTGFGVVFFCLLLGRAVSLPLAHRCQSFRPAHAFLCGLSCPQPCNTGKDEDAEEPAGDDDGETTAIREEESELSELTSAAGDAGFWENGARDSCSHQKMYS